MTISTVKIDPRLLPIDWQTATIYTIVVGSDFVREVGNNRTPSPVRTATITTYDSGPVFSQTQPSYGQTTYFQTATIVLNRPVELTTTSTYNFYLYKEAGASDELIATIPSTGTRVSLSGQEVEISLQGYLEGTETYYLTADGDMFEDMFRFPSQTIVDDSVIKYTTGNGPEIVAVTPTYGQTGTFVSTATIKFDTFGSGIALNQGNLYVHNGEGLFRTLNVSGGSLAVINTYTLAATLYNEVLPEDEYHIQLDRWLVKDSEYNLLSKVVDDDSVLKWTSKSLSDLPNDVYDSGKPSTIFQDWYTILDQDPDPSKEYAIRLFATSGTFTLNEQSFYDVLVKLGTKDEIEAMSDIKFIADVTNMNWDLPVTTTLMKDGTVIATRQNTLVGLPYDLPSMPLVSNTYTNSVGSSTVLTVTANTNSSISTEVTFRTSSTVLGTSTFVNNVASLTLQPDSVNAGTYQIFAQWAGQTAVPKFNGRNSNIIQQTILPKSPSTINLSIPNLPYILRPEVGTGTNPLPVLSANIDGIYPTHLASGEVLLKEGSTVLGSGILSSTATTNISWNPELYNQLDTGNRNLTVSYGGDFWNNTGTNSILFNAKLRNSIAVSASVDSSNVIRPSNVVLRAVSNKSNFSGKSIKWYEGNTLLGTSTFTGFTSSIVLNSYNLDIGQNSAFAVFDGDYNFENTTTNNIFYNVFKRTPTMSISYSPTQLSISTTSFTVNISGLVDPAPTQNLILSVTSTATYRINSPALEYGNVNEVNQWAGGYIVLGATVDSSFLSYVNTSTFNVDSGDDLDIYFDNDLQDMLSYYRYNNEVIGTKGFWKIIRVISPNKIALQAWVDINGTRIPFNQTNDPNVTSTGNANQFPLTKWTSQTAAAGVRSISIRGAFTGNLKVGDVLGTSTLSSTTTQVVFSDINIPSGRYGIRAIIGLDETYNSVSTSTVVNKRL